MRTLLTVAAILCFAALPAYSADGQISQSSLARLGLAGMASLSDAQGLEVRGLGVMDAMQMQGGYGDFDDQDHHKYGDHNRDDDKDRDHKNRDDKHHEHGHPEHKHHEQHHHNHHDHVFKCDFHMKPHCPFGSLCHINGGKVK
ncbi:MAG TPA: hypothetical protein VFG04_25905 [Planctomycetaceae bacterium]|jgi:hypothetical protein|nr:hypothetical protein [Planctomycetaceae bacterium]